MAEAPDINVDELRRRARRRLLGAIVLALAAAVIVPMLLESDPKPLGEDVSVRIPPEDNAKFVNRLSDKGAKTSTKEAAPKSETAKEPAPTAEPAPAPAAPAPTAPVPAAPLPTAPVPTAPAEGATTSTTTSTAMPAAKKSIAQAEQKVLGAPGKPAAATAAPPVAAMAPAPSPPPAAPATPAVDPTKDALKDGYSVQLAAFADDKGANALTNRLKKASYPAYTEPLTTSRGTLWRVRVGPYPSRDAAIEVRDRLKGEGYSGIVAAAK
jgi:DedD protein